MQASRSFNYEKKANNKNETKLIESLLISQLVKKKEN